MNYRRFLLSAYLVANMLCVIASIFVTPQQAKAAGAQYLEICTKPDTSYNACNNDGSLDCGSAPKC